MAKIRKITYNPWWTPKTLEAFGSRTIRYLDAPYKTTTMKYSCETHLPFYSLPMDHVHVMGNMAGVFRGWTGNMPINNSQHPQIHNLWKGLWEGGHYGQFMQLVKYRAHFSNLTESQAVKFIKSIWTEVPPQPNLMLPSMHCCVGALNIVNACKVGQHTGVGVIRSKTIGSGPWRSPQYLFSKYFLAYMNPVHENGTVIGNSPIYESQYVPVPLMSLMFRREHYDLIRGYMYNNKEVPSELLELWVDESLDSLTSNHPIRLQYVRGIKKPLAECGVAVNVVSNLDELMFTRMTVPNHKSLKQSIEWRESKVKSVMDDIRELNGVQIPKPEEVAFL